MDTPTTSPSADPSIALLERGGWNWTCIAVGRRYLVIIQRGDREGGMGWGESAEAALATALASATLRAAPVAPRLALGPIRSPLCA
jgi:hypothetical protein